MSEEKQITKPIATPDDKVDMKPKKKKLRRAFSPDPLKIKSPKKSEITKNQTTFIDAGNESEES